MPKIQELSRFWGHKVGKGSNPVEILWPLSTCIGATSRPKYILFADMDP